MSLRPRPWLRPTNPQSDLQQALQALREEESLYDTEFLDSNLKRCLCGFGEDNTNEKVLRRHICACMLFAIGARFVELADQRPDLLSCSWRNCSFKAESAFEVSKHLILHWRSADLNQETTACKIPHAEGACDVELPTLMGFEFHAELHHEVLANQSRHLVQVDFCLECTLMIVGLEERFQHAEWHFNKDIARLRRDPKCCETVQRLKYLDRSTINTLHCIWCLFDESLHPSARWNVWLEASQQRRHLVKHLPLLEKETVCPHPACDGARFPRTNIFDHMKKYHGVTFMAPDVKSVTECWAAGGTMKAPAWSKYDLMPLSGFTFERAQAKPVCPPSSALVYGTHNQQQ